MSGGPAIRGDPATGDEPSMRPLVVRGLEMRFGSRTYVMGILNATPDSFSGDGLLRTGELDVAAAVALARTMVSDGADIIDVGGESTRPGHAPVGAVEEQARVVGLIVALRAALPDVPISVDTTKPAVARVALEAGADILNDVAAVTGGGALVEVAAAHAAPLILMHGRAHPDYADVVSEVMADLEHALQRAEAAGCARELLIVDPGIGFGKTAAQNLVVLRGLGTLQGLGRPVLLGTSRKSTIGRVLGVPPDERLEGTLATTALGIAAGVDIVRVHDVAANVRVARMSDAIVRGGWHDSGA
jgi:dihydropteroate synthase